MLSTCISLAQGHAVAPQRISNRHTVANTSEWLHQPGSLPPCLQVLLQAPATTASTCHQHDAGVEHIRQLS
jgi:hypothetical protein